MKDAGIHVKACYSKTTSPSRRQSLLPQPPAMTNSVLLQDHNYALEVEHCMGAGEMLLPPAVTDTVTPEPLGVTLELPALTLEPLGVPNAVTMEPLDVTLEPLDVANTVTMEPPAVTLEPLDVPNAVILEPPAVSDAESLTHYAAIDAESSQSLVSQNVFPAMQDHDYLQKSTLMSDNSSVSPEALDLRSSRVKYLKVVKCPHCALVLYKKNLATHIQRKHTKTKDSTATYHLKCVCVDQTHEEYAVQEESSFSVPVHVQHKTHTKCEAGVCGQNQLLALKGGLTSLCQHIQSLDSGVNTATDHFLKAEVLEEMLAFKEMLNSHLRPLKDLVK